MVSILESLALMYDKSINAMIHSQNLDWSIDPDYADHMTWCGVKSHIFHPSVSSFSQTFGSISPTFAKHWSILWL